MAFKIELVQEAWEDLRAFRKSDQVRILDALEVHLSHEPTRVSRSRIKHLRPGTRPPYRLRIDEIRIFYDVSLKSQKVIVYGIVHKEHSLEWLAAFVAQNEDSGSE